MRSLLAGVALVLAAGLTPARDDAEPILFAPKGGKFSVVFPGKPREEKKTLKTALGDAKLYQAGYVSKDQNYFGAGYTVLPVEIPEEQQQTLFDGVFSGIAGKDGEVRSKKESKFGKQKLPMREALIERDEKFIKVRLVLDGDRLYQVLVMGTEDFVKSKEATAFLNSFKITE
ncbi:MAG TPA: hypothetical protein VKE74_14415 [Gemmataceae bacterium]|nr:hypothetical protein [Gemmataceae bacterium]